MSNNLKRRACIAHIIFHASKEPVYGTWIMEELRRHGYNLTAGTLYPWLQDLERQQVLSREDRVINGKIRKYYSLTPKGQDLLKTVRHFLSELANEILH